MSLLITLVIGSFVGWIAGRLIGRHQGVITNVLIGALGSVTGDFLSVVIRGTNQAYLTISWPSLFWAFIGALLFVALLNAVQGNPHHSNG